MHFDPNRVSEVLFFSKQRILLHLISFLHEELFSSFENGEKPEFSLPPAGIGVRLHESTYAYEIEVIPSTRLP